MGLGGLTGVDAISIARTTRVVADEETSVWLRFSPTVASRVRECTWHPSQRVTPGYDAELDIHMTVAGTMEISPWILSWGSEVEVVGPKGLPSRVASIAAQTHAINAPQQVVFHT